MRVGKTFVARYRVPYINGNLIWTLVILSHLEQWAHVLPLHCLGTTFSQISEHFILTHQFQVKKSP
jgi:hypothetical protein